MAFQAFVGEGVASHFVGEGVALQILVGSQDGFREASWSAVCIAFLSYVSILILNGPKQICYIKNM